MASTTTKSEEPDYEFVKELQDELMCSICMKVLNEPQMVNCCEQRFCKGCLTKWIARNNSCPFCRSTDFSFMLSKRQDRKISEVLVFCANKVYGCKSTLKINEYDQHLSVDNAQGCLFTKLPCLNECSAVLFRGDLDNHCKETCPRRMVQCNYCTSEGEYLFIVGVHLEKCPSYPMVCPQECGAEILRKDLTAHQGVCPLELAACPFSDIGCKVKVPRQDLDKHIQSSMLQHMMDMATSHASIKSDHEALVEENAALLAGQRALKGKHAAILETNKAFAARFQAMGVLIKDLSNFIPKSEKKISVIVTQLHTLLVDTSTVEMGSTLSLALSESNTESGHHYIVLSEHKFKFKLEWEILPLKVQALYASDQQYPCQFKLYTVTDKDSVALPSTWSCDIALGVGSRIERTNSVIVCCGKSQNIKAGPEEGAASHSQEVKEKESSVLLGVLTLNVSRRKALNVHFQKHESHSHHNTPCLCNCHKRLSASLSSVSMDAACK